MSNKRVRVLLIVIGLLLVALFAWNIHVYLQRRGLVKVAVQVLPPDSTLKLDGKKTKAGSVYMTAGTHKLTASRQYFSSTTKTINTSDLGPEDVIYLMPEPDSDEAKAWLKDHPKVQAEREAQGSKEAAAAQVRITNKYPIIKKLPVYNSRYEIDYSLDSNERLSFSITLFGILNRPSQYDQYVQQLRQYKAEALKFLVDNYIDPSKFTITYTPDVN